MIYCFQLPCIGLKGKEGGGRKWYVVFSSTCSGPNRVGRGEVNKGRAEGLNRNIVYISPHPAGWKNRDQSVELIFTPDFQ